MVPARSWKISCLWVEIRMRSDARLADGLRLGAHVDGRGADGDLDLEFTADLDDGAAARVEALGLGVREHVGADAELAVVPAVGLEAGGAAEEDERHLPVLGVEGVLAAVVQFKDAELQVFQAAFADLAQRGIALPGRIGLFVIHRISFLS